MAVKNILAYYDAATITCVKIELHETSPNKFYNKTEPNNERNHTVLAFGFTFKILFISSVLNDVYKRLSLQNTLIVLWDWI